MIPFRTIYSELKSDFIPTINLTKHIHNVNAIKEYVSPEVVFSKYKDYDNELTIPNNNLNSKLNSSYINYYFIGLIILCCLLIIILSSIAIKKILNCKKIKKVNVNQPSSTEQDDSNQLKLKVKRKSLPKIIV